MSTTVHSTDEGADLVVRDADVLVTMAGDEVSGGWVAISNGVVDSVGKPGIRTCEPEEVISASGCLVTPGLINTHHHIYQNLTRPFAPVSQRRLAGNWLSDPLQDLGPHRRGGRLCLDRCRADGAGARGMHDDDRPLVRAPAPQPDRR